MCSALSQTEIETRLGHAEEKWSFGLLKNALLYLVQFNFFFFQAEDGIRDRDVTEVQTCALPILTASPGEHVDLDTVVHEVIGQLADVAGQPALDHRRVLPGDQQHAHVADRDPIGAGHRATRSEERRVGKEWRAGRAAHELKKNSR